jgi:iduronate 2-sulfatase
MDKKSVSKSCIVAGIMAVSLPLAAQHNPEKPNILMIVIDDLNDWIGAMNGHPGTITPNMDRLADRGYLFANAHAASPLCGPTRAAVLSGLYPSTTGIYGQNNFGAIKANPVAGNAILLPEYFANHGYLTLATGKIFHEGSPSRAFDVVGQERRDFGPYPPQRFAYTPPDGTNTSTDWGVWPEQNEDMPDWQNALWTADQLNRKHEKPFFMSVGFVRPHVPFYVPQQWFDMHPLENIILPPYVDGEFEKLPLTAQRFAQNPPMPVMEWMQHEQRWEKSVQGYLASISFVDHCVGMVLDALENSPYAQNTIILLWSDHGYHLGEKGLWSKHTLWERSTRIPMIISFPGQSNAKTINRPVNQMDIYPTLVELAGLQPNTKNEGKSLVPLLSNPDAAGFEASITTHGYGNHSVRTLRWRLIRYADGTEELYDHSIDPLENNNLASDERMEAVKIELRRFLPLSDAPIDQRTRLDYNEYFLELNEKFKMP